VSSRFWCPPRRPHCIIFMKRHRYKKSADNRDNIACCSESNRVNKLLLPGVTLFLRKTRSHTVDVASCSLLPNNTTGGLKFAEIWIPAMAPALATPQAKPQRRQISLTQVFRAHRKQSASMRNRCLIDLYTASRRPSIRNSARRFASLGLVQCFLTRAGQTNRRPRRRGATQRRTLRIATPLLLEDSPQRRSRARDDRRWQNHRHRPTSSHP
jgi:hypothetical protein